MRKITFIVFLSTILCGCNSFNKNDLQEDKFFLRKKYALTKVIPVNDDLTYDPQKYLLPYQIGLNQNETFVDFYYGGLEYAKKNGATFLIKLLCNNDEKFFDTAMIESNNILLTKGNYLLPKKKDYSVPFYFTFENDTKHIPNQSKNIEYNMYQGIAFPEYFVRIFIRLNYLYENNPVESIFCLEFGKTLEIHSLDEKPLGD